jgi:hypothetical protein
MRFDKGPINIGREKACQVYLPDRSVSRQHAVILTTPEGDWIVQDMESANRTTVNGRPVSRMALHEGDIVGITDFGLEVYFKDTPAGMISNRPFTPDDMADPGDTLMMGPETIPTIFARKTGANIENTLHLTPSRIKDMFKLSDRLYNLKSEKQLVEELLPLMLEQFDGYHVWVGIQDEDNGHMNCHGGLRRGGVRVSWKELVGRKLLKQSLEEAVYLLVPKIVDMVSPSDSLANIESLGSAMSAPIASPDGVYGIIYIDNGVDQPPYTHQDFDYLILVSIQVAAVLTQIG